VRRPHERTTVSTLKIWFTSYLLSEAESGPEGCISTNLRPLPGEKFNVFWIQAHRSFNDRPSSSRYPVHSWLYVSIVRFARVYSAAPAFIDFVAADLPTQAVPGDGLAGAVVVRRSVRPS
jgi:hypothetical protein